MKVSKETTKAQKRLAEVSIKAVADRKSYAELIAKAKAELEDARTAKSKADTPEDYAKAAEQIRQLTDTIEFYESKLRGIGAALSSDECKAITRNVLADYKQNTAEHAEYIESALRDIVAYLHECEQQAELYRDIIQQAERLAGLQVSNKISCYRDISGADPTNMVLSSFMVFCARHAENKAILKKHNIKYDF